MINNITSNDGGEKRIGLVYNSDSGYYQGFDFSKIDDIESILTDGIDVNVANFAAQSAYVDAFGRQRISNPFTLADYSHVYGEETELLIKTSGNNSYIKLDNF